MSLASLWARWWRKTEPASAASVQRLPDPHAQEATTVLSLASWPDEAPAAQRPELAAMVRGQWQRGEWRTLAQLPQSEIETHPERAKIALAVGSAWQQLGDTTTAKHFLSLAKQWGCSPQLMAQILISGVHNTLGRAASISGNTAQASAHFTLAVKGGGSDKASAAARMLNESAAVSQFAARAAARQQGSVAVADSAKHDPFYTGITSYAQNFEDVMLWRALRHVSDGFYIDIGAQDPVVDSVSMAFHQRGWRGIHVEPVNAYAQALRAQRPGDLVIEAAVADQDGMIDFFVVPGGGLSTGNAAVAHEHGERGISFARTSMQAVSLQHVLEQAAGRDVHWLKIDVEGMEEAVLRGWGSSAVRPWIVLLESTLPLTQIEMHETWEHHLSERGYRHVYSDGLNRFYLAAEQAHLARHFAWGPNVFDGFTLSGTATTTFVKTAH